MPLPKHLKPRYADIKDIDVEKWGEDKVLTLRIPIEDPPQLTKSRKCYRFSHFFGKLKGVKVVTPDGVERDVRIFTYVYAKLTKAETVALVKADEAARASEPQLV